LGIGSCYNCERRLFYYLSTQFVILNKAAFFNIVIMFSNKSKILAAPVIIILLLLPVINLLRPFGFFFEGTWTEHQKWFPHFPFLSFIFFKSFYPVVYAFGLFAVLRGKLGTLPVISLIVIQSVILVLGMQAVGFMPVADYMYLLVLAPFLYRMAGTLNAGHLWLLNRVINLKLPAGSFLFIIYIVLCLSLSRFHPFAKYTMFNKFRDNTTVFLLRDNRDSLLPLNTYCTIDGNHLFELYVAINNKHGFNYGNRSVNTEQQEIVSREMMQSIFTTLKKPIPSDSVRLMRVEFYFENGKLNSNESQFYACKVE
jgi:hypothetical protein